MVFRQEVVNVCIDGDRVMDFVQFSEVHSVPATHTLTHTHTTYTGQSKCNFPLMIGGESIVWNKGV